MKLRQLVRRFGSSAWSGWPERAYERERYRQRLQAVEEHLAECLHRAPAGPVRIVSMCAGDGRDVIHVVRSHPRRKDVSAWLVELDSQSVAAGTEHAARAGLENVIRFLHADATDYATYQTFDPADIVLVCGVWGHVPPHERTRLVRALGCLCKPGGTVIWTRGITAGMSRLREIQAVLAGSSWEEIRVSLTPDVRWAVATHRYCGECDQLPGTGRIFHFERRAGQ